MSWQAARNGLPGDAEAVNQAEQVTQFLATHGITAVWTGTQQVTPAGKTGYGDGGIDWLDLGSVDADQPFTLPGGVTTVGRVTLPLSPVGAGADVQVSLYTDSGGSPGALVTQAVLPAAHLAQLAAPQGLASGGPVATAASGTIRSGDMTTTTWASPVSSGGSPTTPSAAVSGGFIIQAGGFLGAVYTASAYTIAWGGTAPGAVLPQPPLPSATANGTLVATGDTLVYAGGNTASAYLSAVWAAGWSPASGQVQAWTSQAPLPAVASQASGAFDPVTDTVYVLGGLASISTSTQATWYAQVTNGQLGSWHAGPPLPAPVLGLAAATVNGWLVIAGGYYPGSGDASMATWCAQVQADGSLGPWQPGPALPAAYSPLAQPLTFAATESGLVTAAASGSAGLLMTLTVTADGPGQWQAQDLNPVTADALGVNGASQPAAAFSTGAGQWQLLVISPGTSLYGTAPLSSVPAISVPLPASGLTGGGTYHVVLHQLGGTAASYVQAAASPFALPTAAKTRPASGGSWTGLAGGYSLLAGTWDLSAVAPPLHLWEDAGTRFTTLLWSGSGQQLLGCLEAVQFPSGSPEAVLGAVTQVTWGATGLPSGTVQLA